MILTVFVIFFYAYFVCLSANFGFDYGSDGTNEFQEKIIDLNASICPMVAFVIFCICLIALGCFGIDKKPIVNYIVLVIFSMAVSHIICALVYRWNSR